MSEHTEPKVENIEAMFVQSARGLTSSDGSVTFQGLVEMMVDADLARHRNAR